MRRPVPLGIAAAVVVVLLWFVLLWRPRQSDISEAKDRREAAEAEVAQLRTTLARLEELKRGEALARSQLEELRVAVPEQPNLAQFILDANEAAERAGIAFLSITPSPPTADEDADVAAIRLSVNVTGGYFQVLDYLNRLGDLPRVVVIDSLSLQPDEGGRNLTVAVQARMFTTAEPDVATDRRGGPSTTTTAPATTTTVAGATTTTAGPATTATGAP